MFINNLPDDCLTIIFSLCNSYDHWVIYNVCRKWRSVIMYNKVFCLSVLSMETLPALTDHNPKIQTFICRNFERIVSHPVWLEFPIETVSFICSKDLCICSEIQVLSAILKWIVFDASRIVYCNRLLNLVRWTHLEYKHWENLHIENLFNRVVFDYEIFDRTKQKYHIWFADADNKLFITAYDYKFKKVTERSMQQEKTIRFDSLHPEHVSDILIDGIRLLRIDWWRNTYKRIIDLAEFLMPMKQVFKIKNAKLNADRIDLEFKNVDANLFGATVLDGHKNYVSIVGHDSFLQIETKLELVSSENTRKNFHAAIFFKDLYVLFPNLELKCIDLDNGQILSFDCTKIVPKIFFDSCFISCYRANELFLFNAKTGDFFTIDIILNHWVFMFTMGSSNKNKMQYASGFIPDFGNQ